MHHLHECKYLRYVPSLMNSCMIWLYPWQEKWKFPGTRSTSNHPVILHPFPPLKSLKIRVFFSSCVIFLSLYKMFPGISYFFTVSPIFTLWTFSTFSTSRLNIEHAYLGNSISMFTRSGSFRCCWSIIKSLLDRGYKNSWTVINTIRRMKEINTIEMQAPDTVP